MGSPSWMWRTTRWLAVVQVGRGPCQIILTPDPTYALVLNEKSGDMAVVCVLALSTAPNGGRRKSVSAPIFTLIPEATAP